MKRQDFAFQQGGEMGELTTRYDWSTTSLGTINNWPVSLRVHVSMMLATRFPSLIFWGPDLITFYNDAFRPSLGNEGKHPSSLGQKGEDSWAESWPTIGPLIHSIMAGGDAVWFEDQKLPIYREGKMDYAYWTYSFSPLRDDQHQIAGILVTCTETTKGVESLERLSLLQQEQELAIEAAELGTFDYNPLGGTFTANDRLKHWFGLQPDEDIALPLALAVIADHDRDRVSAAIGAALKPGSNGQYEEEYTIVHPQTGEQRIVQAKGRAQFSETGESTRLNGTLRDVTVQRLAYRAIAASETKFRSLVTEAPFAIGVYVGDNLTIELANDAMLNLLGKTKEAIGRPLIEAVPELEGQPFIGLLQNVRRTGIAYETKEQPGDLIVDGRLQRFWFNFSYKPLYDEAGQVYGILNMAADVSGQVAARKKIEEAELKLKDAIEVAELGTWSIDARTKQITYSERLQDWLGVYEATLESGDSPNIIEADRSRVRQAITKALEPGGTGSFDEIYTIQHQQTGQKRIIHVNGRTLFDTDGQPLVLAGAAQDVTLQQQLQLKLETEVQIRTEELAAAIEELRVTNEELSGVNNELTRSNEELAQYAYVASHDLQEPLRKIRLFISQLAGLTGMPERAGEIISRVQQSSERMSLLISDLLEFSRLLKSDTLLRPVKLDDVLANVKSDFELVIAEKNAQVDIGPLPVIEAVRLQVNQLFYNLIGNALKFTSTGRPPVVTVSSRLATEEEIRGHVEKRIPGIAYHFIEVADNGIGFEAQHVEQIFQLFQRLHGRSAYGGSGIGLAICRRIVHNLQGSLFAEAQPGCGASFFIILPAKQTLHYPLVPSGLSWTS